MITMKVSLKPMRVLGLWEQTRVGDVSSSGLAYCVQGQTANIRGACTVVFNNRLSLLSY